MFLSWALFLSGNYQYLYRHLKPQFIITFHSDYFCKSYQCFFLNKSLFCLYSRSVNTILTFYIPLGRHSYQFLQLQYCMNAPWPHKYQHIITHHQNLHHCYNPARGPSICRYINIEPYSPFVYILINIL